MLAGLVRAGLAAARREVIKAGGKTIKVGRVKITAAGRVRITAAGRPALES
jgi:hypothetical protein